MVAVQYHKKIYQPGLVLAKVQVERTDYSDNDKELGVTPAQVIAYFRDKTIELKRGDDTVASDYYIYKVLPEYRRDSNSYQNATVTLYCYSRDHKLSLNPYCKTYVNKKLVGDSTKTGDKADGIIMAELTEEKGNGILQKAGFSETTLDYANLRLLKYITKANADGTEIERKEFIQPYLVQYNESFYDFLARTANRCGEFLYHEEGALHIGIPKTTDSVDATLKTSDVLAYRHVGYSTPIITPTNDYTDGMDLGKDKNEPVLYATGTYIYYDELPIDEYLGMYLISNQFTSYKKEFFKDWGYLLVNLLNDVLNSAGLPLMAAKVLEKYTESMLFAISKTVLKNKEKIKKWIDPMPSEQKTEIPPEWVSQMVEGMEPDQAFKLKVLTTPLNPTMVSLYGSLLSTSVQHLNYAEQQNLNSKFYRFIDKCCQAVGRQLVEVDANEESPTCALGNIVSFDNASYIVIEVKENLLNESAGNTAGQTLVLAPVFKADVKKYKNHENGVDNYTTNDTFSFFCPPPVVPFVRTTGAQRAFVAKNGDPEGFGRVCIRYPWQQKKDTPSPWIRMAVPFAPNDGVNDNAGFFFEPSEGDEVLVEYENGNIEHPYIVGALYTRRTKAPGSDRSIVSRKGHSLSFNDGDSGSDFFTGILPAYSLATKYASLGNAKINWLGDDCVSGGITLSDKWGLYKISASSTDRNITIKSPFGDINISAFSGITISAPNGDITIKGKNVNIEAGNELKLTSGKFIDEKKEYEKTFKKTLVTSVVSSMLAPLVDLSLLRTMMDAFLKPVAGTLTIQSGRYLLLNAGGGKAEIPNRGLSIGGINRATKQNDKIMFANTLSFIKEVTDKWIDDITSLYENIKTDLELIKQKEYLEDMQSPNGANHGAQLLTEVQGHIKTAYKEEDLTFPQNYANIDAVRATLCDPLNILRENLLAIQNYCKEPNKQIGIESSEHYNLKAIRYIIQTLPDSLLPQIITSIKGQQENYTGNPDWNAAKKQLRRVMAVKLITESMTYAKMFVQVPDATINGGVIVDFTDTNEYSSDKKWEEFIKLLKEYKKSPEEEMSDMLKDAVKGKLTENLPYFGWKAEHKLWDTYKMGEILMADKGSSETINIVNGALNRSKSTKIIDKVKDTLRNF